jgi:hypothetical protein
VSGYVDCNGYWREDNRTEGEKRRDALWLLVLVFGAPVWLTLAIAGVVLIVRAAA